MQLVGTLVVALTSDNVRLGYRFGTLNKSESRVEPEGFLANADDAKVTLLVEVGEPFRFLGTGRTMADGTVTVAPKTLQLLMAGRVAALPLASLT